MSNSEFVRLPLQKYLYSATAAAMVQLRLHEPCSMYYFASWSVRQKVSYSFVPLPFASDSGDATVSEWAVMRQGRVDQQGAETAICPTIRPTRNDVDGYITGIRVRYSVYIFWVQQTTPTSDDYLVTSCWQLRHRR